MRALRRRWFTAAWLLLVWLALWHAADPATVLFGAIVVVVIVAAFPVAAGEDRFVIRPWWLLVLAGFLLGDVALSAVRVGRDAVLLGFRVRAAIIEVELISGVDHVVTLAANLLTLSPGTFVVDIDRTRGVCYVYVLGVRGDDDLDKVRKLSHRMQRLVLLTFGPPRRAESTS
ncbi:MAG: sodium:proton antiporter [Actinophytocola sp.]|nr:sodium:proton antiporter [Actinophytocola sp.]